MLRATKQTRKVAKVIATALKLQEVTKEALFQEPVMDFAGEMMIDFQDMSLDEFHVRLFQYSMLVSAMAVTLATDALLTDEQATELIDTINEMEAISSAIQNGDDEDLAEYLGE